MLQVGKLLGSYDATGCYGLLHLRSWVGECLMGWSLECINDATLHNAPTPCYPPPHHDIRLLPSPVGAKFARRAQQFPGLINGCTIDWFLPWPEEALTSGAWTPMATTTCISASRSFNTTLLKPKSPDHPLVLLLCAAYDSTSRYAHARSGTSKHGCKLVCSRSSGPRLSSPRVHTSPWPPPCPPPLIHNCSCPLP